MKTALALSAVVLALAACSAEKHAAPTRTETRPARNAPRKPTFVNPHNRPVPILTYHVIGTPPADAPFPELYVDRAAFAAQLRWLRRHGYQAVSLRRVYEYWKRGLALPPRPVVLTFDDGYREDFTNVRPLLARHHWPGVLNLAVQNVLDRKLTVPQVRTLAQNGWEIDAHSLTHPDLTTLGSAELRRQVAGSRTWIRRHVRVPVEFFCYPAGRYDAAVLRAVRTAGFRGATTTVPGDASPRDGFFTLDRWRVYRSDSLSSFAAKLQ